MVWPSVKQHDRRRRGAAQLGEDLADAVAEPRLRAGGLERPRRLGDGRLEVARPVDLGQQLSRVRDAVDPDLVLLLQLPDQPGLVLEDQALGDGQPRRSTSPSPDRPSVGTGRRLRDGTGSGPGSIDRRVARAVWSSGFSYWSAIRSLAESSTRIVR